MKLKVFSTLLLLSAGVHSALDDADPLKTATLVKKYGAALCLVDLNASAKVVANFESYAQKKAREYLKATSPDERTQIDSAFQRELGKMGGENPLLCSELEIIYRQAKSAQ